MDARHKVPGLQRRGEGGSFGRVGSLANAPSINCCVLQVPSAAVPVAAALTIPLIPVAGWQPFGTFIH